MQFYDMARTNIISINNIVVIIKGKLKLPLGKQLGRVTFVHLQLVIQPP